MTLVPGTRLGAYEILSAIGAGGMGEVFAAEDTRLHRQVAIKFLPSEVASEPQHRERFKREARAIAALNHPNIVTLYSVEEVDGLIFLAMERLTGRTLQEVIPAGGLPIAQLLRTATAIADAVAAAHQQGITHRDLKPANVMVTNEGRVKVLDFGLAKLHVPDHANLSTRPALTDQYQVVGTVSYMSPEQAEGKTVDSRSDIFSLGIMLHEMATGDRPFRGGSSASIISAILRDDPPPLTELRPELPTGLNRIVKRCLAKDSSARYQSALDLRHDLQELADAADSGDKRYPGARRIPRRFIPVATVALVALIGAAVAWVGLPRQRTPLEFEAERFSRLTSDGDVNVAAISPDGRHVVHVKHVNDRPSLWVRQIGTTTDVQVVEPRDVRYHAISYSRDGAYIYFTSLGSLFRVSALGGTPRRLIEKDVDSGVAFSPDGKQLAFVRPDKSAAQSHLVMTDTDGDGERRIATVGVSLMTPSWSPDGASLLVVTHAKDFSSRAVYTVNIHSGSVEPLTDAWPSIGAAVWLPDGKSFLMTATDTVGSPAQIWQVFRASRERRRITNDVNSYSGLSISADGKTIAAMQAETITTLWKLTHSYEYRAQLSSGRRDDGSRGVAWSANGQIVFASSRSGKTELWAMQADGTRLRQLTESSGWSPAASKDGRWFVFVDGRLQLWRGSFDDSPPTLLTAESGVFHPMIDAAGWVHYSSTMRGAIKTFRVPLSGGDPIDTSTELSQNVGALGALFHPYDTLANGDVIGCKWDQKQQKYFAAIRPAGGGAVRTLRHVVIQSPRCPTLKATPDGALSFIQLEAGRLEIWRQSMKEAPAVQLTQSGGDDVFSYAWSPDGKQLVVSRGRRASDVVLIHRKR